MVTPQANKQVENILAESEQLAKKLDWVGAANRCREAVALSPDNTLVLGKLGWYLSRSKQYDESIKTFEKLAKLEPKLAKWPYMIGYQYYDQKHWKDAIAWFEQALSKHEKYYVVLYRKGYAHVQLNEKEAAKEAFEKCIKIWENLSPEEKEKERNSYSDACFQLGKLHLSFGLSRKAEVVFAEAVKFDSQDAHKFYEYGKALLKNQKPEEALVQLQKAEKIEPRKDYIIAYIAQALIDLSRIEEADKMLARIPDRQRKEYIWRAVGRVRLGQGRIKEAIDAINRGIRIDSKNHNAYYHLGLAYIADNDYPQAHHALSRAIEIRKSVYNLDFPEAKQKLDEVLEYAKNNSINLTLPQTKSADAPMGIIAKYNDAKGFGFIKRGNGEPDLFFHISCVLDPDNIQVGQGVNFVVEDSPKGLRANKITFVDNN